MKLGILDPGHVVTTLVGGLLRTAAFNIRVVR
jgi:hypothetical protein